MLTCTRRHARLRDRRHCSPARMWRSSGRPTTVQAAESSGSTYQLSLLRMRCPRGGDDHLVRAISWREARRGACGIRDAWPTAIGTRLGGQLMKALVYHGPGQKAWEEAPDPEIVDPTDVVVQVDTTTICGTDLHILKGDVPAVTDGRILGHEGVGTITEVGQAVSKLAVGDRVIISCITSCGSCSYCHQQLPSHCLDDEGTSGIGWIFGHLINGTQAEYVRVPFAESSLHKLPEGVSDEAAVMLSDILPTGFEIGVRNGRVARGDVVALIGAGPVGLAAMMTAGLYGASRIIAIDLDDNRVEQAKGFGATDAVNSGGAGWRDAVLAMTDGLGVDVAIEAVGVPGRCCVWSVRGMLRPRQWSGVRSSRPARRTQSPPDGSPAPRLPARSGLGGRS